MPYFQPSLKGISFHGAGLLCGISSRGGSVNINISKHGWPGVLWPQLPASTPVQVSKSVALCSFLILVCSEFRRQKPSHTKASGLLRTRPFTSAPLKNANHRLDTTCHCLSTDIYQEYRTRCLANVNTRISQIYSSSTKSHLAMQAYLNSTQYKFRHSPMQHTCWKSLMQSRNVVGLIEGGSLLRQHLLTTSLTTHQHTACWDY
jgi:hypothetical protein